MHRFDPYRLGHFLRSSFRADPFVGLAAVLSLTYVASGISPLAVGLVLALALTPVVRRSILRKTWVWEIGALVYFFVFLADVLFFSRHLGIAITHLLAFLVVSRYWVEPDVRVLRQRLTLAFVFWLLIGATNNDVYFFFASLFMVPVLIWCLMYLQVEPEGSDRRFPLQSLVWSLGVSLFVVPVGIGLFYIMPRYRTGYLRSISFQTGESISGINTRVSLSDITRIKSDPKPAFRVEWLSPPPDPERIYWRVLVFDRFDGRTWSNRLVTHTYRHRLGPRGPGVYLPAFPATGPGLPLRYRIEPLAPLPALVFTGQPAMVRFYGSLLQVSSALELRRENYRTYLVSGQWQSTDPGLYRLRDLETAQSVQLHYTRVPESLRSAERYARAWIPAGLAPLVAAQRLERRLREGFTYTTRVNSTGVENPILAFLDHRLDGHCEYFASAMVLLLRMRGIPARLVTGYRGAEMQGSRRMLVRQSRAHAWVEVWDKASGTWVAFDPTPAVTQEQGWQRVLAWIRDARNSIEAWWDAQVLLFSAQDQMEFLQQIRGALRQWRSRFMGFLDLKALTKPSWRRLRQPLHRMPWLSLIVGGLIGVLLGWRFLMRRRRRPGAGGVEEVCGPFYRLMRAIQRRYGPRRDDETWEEYLQRLASVGSQFQSVLFPVVRDYEQIRYRTAPPPALQRRFEARVEEVRRALTPFLR